MDERLVLGEILGEDDRTAAELELGWCRVRELIRTAPGAKLAGKPLHTGTRHAGCSSNRLLPCSTGAMINKGRA